MTYAVESWTFPRDEDPEDEEMMDSAEFGKLENAQKWVWERLQEGYAVRLWPR